MANSQLHGRHKILLSAFFFLEGTFCVGKTVIFISPTTKNYRSTHTLRHTSFPLWRKFFFPVSTGFQHPASTRLRNSACELQRSSDNILYKAPMLSNNWPTGVKKGILIGDCFIFWNPVYLATLSGPGAGRGSVGTIGWMTWWSHPTVVRREWLSGDQVASLTKSLWARLLNLEQRGKNKV
jgi:hypothetical protein